ncbi:hypothetical protein HY501_01350 [Candidatus Woesearchaeota archaeon]|nr:hypothetical protein [Candidatus Woesearchaeota archaeon]
MEKRLSVIPVASALGFFGGLVYLICASAFLLFPEGSLALMGTWFHGISLTRTPMGWGSFLVGLVTFVAASAGAGALFAVVYNRCHKHCEKYGWA